MSASDLACLMGRHVWCDYESVTRGGFQFCGLCFKTRESRP